MSMAYTAVLRSIIVTAAVAAAPLSPAPARAEAPAIQDVLATYSNMAEAAYGDSLAAARALKTAIDALIASPSERPACPTCRRRPTGSAIRSSIPGRAA